MSRKTLIILLMMALFFSSSAISAFAESDDPDYSGVVNETLIWTLDNGTLTITNPNTDEPTYFGCSYWPSESWSTELDAHSDEVETIIFGDGVLPPIEEMLPLTDTFANIVKLEFIGDVSFGSGCKCTSEKLNTIIFHKEVLFQEYGPFLDCTNLKTVSFLDEAFISSMGEATFKGCTSLEAISLPDGLTSVGVEAFSGCNSLKTVNIPDSTISIESNAFYGCSQLDTITLPSSLRQIHGGAFAGCRNLSHFVIPKKITTIGDDAFYNCADDFTLDTPTGSTAYYYAMRYDIPIVHSFSEWSVIEEATTTETGLKERICSGCNEKEQEIIPIQDSEPGQPSDKERIEALEAQLSELLTQHQTLADEIASLQTQLAALNAGQQGHSTQIADLETLLTQAQTVQQEQADKISTLETQLLQAQAAQHEQADMITSLEAQLAQAQAIQQEQSNTITSLETLLTETGTTQQRQSDKIEALETSFLSIEKRIQALQTLTANLFEAQKLSQSSYTKGSWNIFTTAFENGKMIVGDTTATLQMIEKADRELTTARNSLIYKKNNPLAVTTKTTTIKFATLKKKNQAIARVKILKVKRNQGKVIYTKTQGSSKITISKATGKVTVKKGLKKGTYKIKVLVTAQGNDNYKKGSKAVILKIRVK